MVINIYLIVMEYTELLEKQIIGRLKVDNPWWTEGGIPDFLREMTPRLYIDIGQPAAGCDTNGSASRRKNRDDVSQHTEAH